MRGMVFVFLAALALVGVAFGQTVPTPGIDWGSPQTWNNGGAWLLIGCGMWLFKTEGLKRIDAWIDAQKASAIAATAMAQAMAQHDRLLQTYFVATGKKLEDG